MLLAAQWTDQDDLTETRFPRHRTPRVISEQPTTTASLFPARLTPHAMVRCAQRALASEQVSYILHHGKPLQRTGVTFVVLRRCDIPRADRRFNTFAKLEGGVVILNERGSVVTAYKGKDNYRSISRKFKGRARSKRRLLARSRPAQCLMQ